MWSFAADFLARCRAQSMLLRTIRELLVDERDDMAPRREHPREVLFFRTPPHEKHAEEPWREFRPDTHNLRNFGIIRGMNKCFNIAGPCLPDEHYMLPALERLPGIMRIVE